MKIPAPILCAPLLLALGTATAQSGAMPSTASAANVTTAEADTDLWRLIASPSTFHYHYSPDHRHVVMLGLERQRADGYLLGGSWFRNSFGQPSAYLYAGRRFDHIASQEPLFVQLTGGLLYGYKPPYENKVPLNHNGYSPGAVLSLGWQFTPTVSTQLNFLGTAAVMFQVSADFR
jgi:hypothetical protein